VVLATVSTTKTLNVLLIKDFLQGSNEAKSSGSRLILYQQMYTQRNKKQLTILQAV
jgi:hypothetical protein